MRIKSTLSYFNHVITWGTSNAQFRAKGPCLISVDGEVIFSQLAVNQDSRRSGPSIIYPDGYIVFTNKRGQIHRVNGPAVIRSNDTKEYYINATHVLPEEFLVKYGVL